MNNQRIDQELRGTLLAKALFSAMSGLVMSLAPSALANLMGLASSGWLLCIGVNLIAFAVFLAWLARRDSRPRPILWAVVGSDVAWVLLSVIGVMFLPHQLTQMGIFLILDLAAVVAAFAICQSVFLSRRFPTSPSFDS